MSDLYGGGDKTTLISNEYDELLSSLIPMLQNFSYKRGGEGIVYFIDDNFIVKKFYPSAKEAENSFVKYCNEMANFHELGFCVPKFYAFKIIEDMLNPYNGLYILEERAKGHELYIEHDSDEFYAICKDFCGVDEFNKALKQKEGPLYEKIMETYISDFVRVNEDLADISDVMLENFILSNFDMRVQGKYSSPDVQPRNILFDGKNLTMIDNLYLKLAKLHGSDESQEKIITMKKMVDIVLSNDEISYVISPNLRVKKITKLLGDNQKLCAKLMKRFVKKTNELISPVYTKKYYYNSIVSSIEGILKEKDANQIISELQKDF